MSRRSACAGAELNRDVPVPAPPFWGPQTIARVPVKALVPYLNERMLYQFQWGYRKDGRSLAEYQGLGEEGAAAGPGAHRRHRDPRGHPGAAGRLRLLECAAEGNDVILFDDGRQAGGRPLLVPAPEQGRRRCASPISSATCDDRERDVIGLQVVTMGRRASEVAREWFAENRYQDYLYLHGLVVEMAEALAEYVHKRIRAELGFAAEDARDHRRDAQRKATAAAAIRFGYPACPNLADQALLDLLRADEIGIELSDEASSTPSKAPPPSSCTTRRRSTSRSKEW